MAATNVRNGIDIDRLGEMVRQVQEDPSLALAKFEARSRWEGGFRTRSEISYFWMGGERDSSRANPHVVETDVATSTLGGDAAANSIELMLAALGSSLAVGYAAQAALRGVTVESLELTLQGDLDMRMFLGLSERVHSGLQLIRVKGTVRSDASEEVLKEIKTAAEHGSPVWNSLTHPVKIISTLTRG
jgi:uncharacterized OsmC-like protein